MSSSSFIARWLFRALLGAAFGRKGWKWFWREVPIYPREAFTMANFQRAIMENYLEPIKLQLQSTSPFLTALNQEVKGVQEDLHADMMRYAAMMPKPKPLTRTQKLKRKIRYKLHRLKPVLITQGKLEDVERDY
jgi:hypothetical protein